jgi:superfamily II DNA helicase RecQ
MMGLRVFTLAFDPATARFNDEPVREFLADKDVESVRDHFFVKDGTPYLVLVARYRLRAWPAPVPSAEGEAKGGRQRDESWRDWRGERARREGVPSYVICNNRQLAEVVGKRPASLAELGQVDGFGDAKLKKYGADILALMAGAAGKAPEGGDAEA